jgi:hypothetical protein
MYERRKTERERKRKRKREKERERERKRIEQPDTVSSVLPFLPFRSLAVSSAIFQSLA